MSIKWWDNTGKHWDGNLFGATAEKMIESWVDTWVDKNNKEHEKILSTSQLRKYYNEIKNLENRFNNLINLITLSEDKKKETDELANSKESEEKIKKAVHPEDKKETKKYSDFKEEAWKDIHPLLIMVKAKIRYDVARADSGVTKGFKEYLEKCIDSVNNYKDFEAFTKFFEACVGYYYGKTANPNQNKPNPQNQKQPAQQGPQQAKPN
ncbi:MAG: type III-A CRISPR-associated protein Csm2 [Leptospiraceae bacterium]|nr:type III-A CRISPR-associated protein Csm2 [Leptospiraceae bacterium]